MSGTSVDVTEVFGSGGFTSNSSSFNLVPGLAFDLRRGYDLSDESVRESVWEHLKRDRSWLIIGSPPCAAFSTLAALNPGTSEFGDAVTRGL